MPAATRGWRVAAARVISGPAGRRTVVLQSAQRSPEVLVRWCVRRPPIDGLVALLGSNTLSWV